MRKMLNTSILPTFFLILGLASCAKEKKPVADTFSLGTPEIRSSARHLHVTEASLQATAVSDDEELVFPNLIGHDFDSVSVNMNVESACHTEKRFVSETMVFRNKDSIRVSDLLPVQALRPGDESAWECKVHILAKNSHGSRHELMIPSVSVHVRPSRNELSIQTPAQTIVDSANLNTIDEATARIMRVIDESDTQDSAASSETAHLLCETYRAEISGKDFRNYGVARLLEAKLQTYDGLALRDRSEMPVQNCRIAIETTAASHMTKMTPVFRLRAPVDLPTIVLSTLFPAPFLSHAFSPVTTVTISNPYDHALAIALTDNVTRGVFVAPLVGTAQDVGSMPLHGFDTHWEPITAPLYRDVNLIKYVIPPKQSVSLTLLIQHVGMICTKGGDAYLPQGILVSFDLDKFHLYVFKNNDTKVDAVVDDAVVISPFGDGTGKTPSRWYPAWSKRTQEPEAYSLFQDVEHTQFLQPSAACHWEWL